MLQSFFAAGLDRVNDPLFSHYIRWHNTSRIKDFLSEEIKNAIASQNIHDQIEKILPESFGRWDYLAKAQYIETILFLSSYLLSSQGDRMAMGHSVEIRLPYLDYRLMNLMAQVPSKWKIRGLSEKYILKKSFQNLLPDEIVNRAKHPYRAPVSRSLLSGKSAWYTREALSEHALKKAGLFHPERVKNLLNKLQTVENPGERENMALAGILSTQLIHEKFVTGFTTPMNRTTPALVVDRRT
jgi:asparagine synthase (glutamine-hydrolysing)